MGFPIRWTDKPHIKRTKGWGWTCSSTIHPLGVLGHAIRGCGDSPAAAYRAWKWHAQFNHGCVVRD